MEKHISLTLGPLLFLWPVEKIWDFYMRVADEAPVDIVCLGEVVCSKRMPLHSQMLPALIERLSRGGKTVVLSGQALVTLVRERNYCAELMRTEDLECEINDLAALAYLEAGRPFRVGPFVNIYNESTLRFFASRGAQSICLPPELGIGAVKILAGTAREQQIGCEVWSFGRIPLAISARCYHARMEGLTKDACQYVCSLDSDGREIDTLERKPILAVNGVQTLSHTYCNMIGDIDQMVEVGVDSLRLSPHSCDMIAVSSIFRDRLDSRIDDAAAWENIRAVCNNMEFSNGFLLGKAGVEMVTHA